MVKQLAEAEEARRKAAPPKSPFERLAAGLDTRQLVSARTLGAAAAPSTDYRATEARRHDELIASHERAAQQVEDHEAELVRLRQEHAEIVRPDARLWWGIAILIIFTALGVALPLWVMSQGPQNLAPVRWVFYPLTNVTARWAARPCPGCRCGRDPGGRLEKAAPDLDRAPISHGASEIPPSVPGPGPAPMLRRYLRCSEGHSTC